MSPNPQNTFRPLGATLGGATNVTITNLVATTAGQEYSHTMQTGCRGFMIRCRQMADLQIAFVTGESLTKYITIPRGATFSLDLISFTGKTLYVTASKDGATIEILETH